jgi:excisionase family DNA binding protein
MTSQSHNPPHQATGEILFTVKQAAQQLALSPSSVYELIATGRIHAFRLGPRRGAIRIRKKDLQAYLDIPSSTTPAIDRERTGRLFKHLDAERLRAAWRQQGAIADQTNERNTPSSESSYDP